MKKYLSQSTLSEHTDVKKLNMNTQTDDIIELLSQSSVEFHEDNAVDISLCDSARQGPFFKSMDLTIDSGPFDKYFERRN